MRQHRSQPWEADGAAPREPHRRQDAQPPRFTWRELMAWAALCFACWAGITLVIVLWWEGRL